MKKKIIAALMVSAMAASLCACGSDNSAAGNTENTENTASTVSSTEAGASEVLTTETGTETETAVESSVNYDGPASCTIGLDYAACLTDMADYSAIPITVDSSYEITDDSLNDYLYQLMAYYGGESTIAVTDHDVVQENDIVDVDYTGYLDGESFTGDSAANDVIDVANNGSLSGSSYIDGFSELIVGAKVGETIQKQITFPDPYTANTDLSGKETTFEFTINSICRPVTFDDLTDEMVANVFADNGLETVDALKTAVENVMNSNLYQQKVNAVKSYMIDGSTVEVPEDYLNARVYEYAESYETMNCSGSNLETYLSSNYGVTLDTFYTEMTEEMEEEIKTEIIFGTIAEKENMTVDEDEYSDYIEYYIANTSLGLTDEQSLYEYYGDGDAAVGEEFMRQQYLVNIAIDEVVGNAVVTFQ